MSLWGLFGQQNIGKSSMAGRLAPNALAITTPGGIEHFRTTLLNGIGVSPRHVMDWAKEMPGKTGTVYPIDAIIINLSTRYGKLRAQWAAVAAKAGSTRKAEPSVIFVDGAPETFNAAADIDAIWITPAAEPGTAYGYTTVIIDDLKLIINASRSMWKVGMMKADGLTREMVGVDDIDPLKRKEAAKEIGAIAKVTFMKWLDSLNVKFPGVDFIITGHDAQPIDHPTFGYTPGGMAWETKSGAPELAGYFLMLIRMVGDFVDQEGNILKFEARKKMGKALSVRSPVERFASAAASYLPGCALRNVWVTKDKFDVYSADDNDCPPAATIGLFIGGGKRSAYPFSYAGYEFIPDIVEAVLAVVEKDADADPVALAKAEYEKRRPRGDLPVDRLGVWLSQRDWAVHEAWAACFARSRLHERLA